SVSPFAFCTAKYTIIANTIATDNFKTRIIDVAIEYCVLAFSSVNPAGYLKRWGNRFNIVSAMKTTVDTTGSAKIIDLSPKPSAVPLASKWIGITSGNDE